MLALLLAACQGADEESAVAPDPAPVAEAGADEDAADEEATDECESIEARLSTHQPPGNADYEAKVLFVEELSQRTDGRISVEIFDSASLGNLAENHELVRTGAVEFSLNDPGTLSNYWPELSLVQFPFIFSSVEETDALLDGPAGEFIAMRLREEVGITPLYSRSSGGREMFFVEGIGPVRTPADMAGLTMRIPDVPAFVEMIELLGATPVVIEGVELYSALETGIADGFEFPVIPAVNLSLHEPVASMSLTSHVVAFNWVVANSDFLEGLCEADRQAVDAAAAEAQVLLRSLYLEQGVEFYDMLNETLEVYEVDLDAFREAVTPMYANFVAEHGTELLTVLEEQLGISIG